MRPANSHRSEICCALFASWLTIIVAGIAHAGGPTITLQPVPPKTVPASSYPPGTTIVGQEITLGSVPARVWLEIHVTGFPTTGAPDCARTVQVKIDASDLDMDGGGYFGTNADCMGDPANGENLDWAAQSCTGSTLCRQNMSGIASACFAGEPSTCNAGFCASGFQDLCDPQWIAAGIMFICAVDAPPVPDRRFGVTVNDDASVCLSDHMPSYLGTVVLDIPVNARGSYTLDFVEAESFMLNGNNPPDHIMTIENFNNAIITIPCGACCTGLFGAPQECVDHVTKVDCPASPDQAFTADQLCNDNGAPTCPVACATNNDCNDADFCTAGTCPGTGYCTFTPVASWDQAIECCNPPTGLQAPRPASTSCRVGVCSLGGSSGTPGYTPRPDGTACSDDPCYEDGQCTAGQCIASQHAGSNCPKSRFISFDTFTGTSTAAYRVRMVSLHHPNPPYTGGPTADFSAFEGQYRWVGAPDTYDESSANPDPVFAALVGCDPHYQDWSAIDLLHVSGAEIVPSSEYEVQSIAEGLDINVEANYSAPVSIITSRWCDVEIPNSPPSLTEQPDVGDHAALVQKFRSRPGAISKPRALLGGSGPGGIPDLGVDMGFAEIAAAVDAFKSKPYPYAGPAPCP